MMNLWDPMANRSIQTPLEVLIYFTLHYCDKLCSQLAVIERISLNVMHTSDLDSWEYYQKMSSHAQIGPQRAEILDVII